MQNLRPGHHIKENEDVGFVRLDHVQNRKVCLYVRYTLHPTNNVLLDTTLTMNIFSSSNK